MAVEPQLYSIIELNTAIATALYDIPGVTWAQDLDEMTEQLPEMDLPLAQVYPESWVLVGGDGDTTFNTFSGSTFGGPPTQPMQRVPYIFNMDIYVAPRNLLAENMSRYAEIAHAANELLLAQRPPYFGHPAIKSFNAEAERAIIEYSEMSYLAIRYTLTIEVY